MPFLVRKAIVDDLADVYLFELAYIREIEPEAEPRWRAATHRLLAQWIRNLPRMFVALQEMKSVGHCFWQIEDGAAQLASIYVSPQWRRQGCGLLLLRSFEEDAQGQGFSRLTLSVHQSNTARHLYEQAGYSKTRKSGAYNCYEKMVGTGEPL